jgi:hypothetical protein
VIGLRRIAYMALILFGIFLTASGTALGAALLVDGDASPVNAAPGNSNNILMVISVMDQNGNAVSGLGATNFAVGSIVVGPGGALSDLKSASEASGASGFYTLNLVPTTYRGTQYKWVKGTYLFSVTVTSGQNRGQTVVDLKM